MTAESHENQNADRIDGAPVDPAQPAQTPPAPAAPASAAAQPVSAPPERRLEATLEALLFVSPGAVTSAQLAAALELPAAEIEAALDVLDHDLQGRGLRLQRHRGRFQLTSAPEAAHVVERFLGLESSSRLSRAALEALAIILYRQPVTRPQIDAIRGVNSDYVVKGLLMKGLIQEVGRADLPGRPILYSVTQECLQYFGLASLDELPPLNLEPAAQE